MFGLGILKGTMMGVGIGILAGIALKDVCNKLNKNKVKTDQALDTEK